MSAARPAGSVAARIAADPVRLTVTLGVLSASLTAWAVTWALQGAGGTAPMGMGEGLLVPGAAGFVALWTLGMVAMMFPIMAPAVLVYERLHRGDGRGPLRAAGPPLFLTGYLGVYAAMGAIALAALAAAGAVAVATPTLASAGWLAAPILLAAAGIYEVSPLKQRCLAAVHSPFSLFMSGWRPGLAGALVMGGRHGAYCAGCCWMYMLVLLVVGGMGLFWMAGFAAVIAVERSSGAWGPTVSKVIAVGLVGAAVLLALQGPAPGM